MKIDIPLFQGFTLKIASVPSRSEGYPTERLQKGLLLFHEGQALAEEGVGFGVPVLKQGLKTIFPGGIQLEARRRGPVWELTAIFDLNLEEKVGRPGAPGVNSRFLYTLKDSLAGLIRRSPALRGPLTAASSGLRWMLGWETKYEPAEFSATVKMTYTVHGAAGTIGIVLDAAGLPRKGITEVVVMNELGAHHFDRYRDSGGRTLLGREIGTWEEVTAGEAAIISAAHQVAITLQREKGARLFRGRELVGSRLAWCGFGYSLPGSVERFRYDVSIERLP